MSANTEPFVSDVGLQNAEIPSPASLPVAAADRVDDQVRRGLALQLLRRAARQRSRNEAARSRRRSHAACESV